MATVTTKNYSSDSVGYSEMVSDLTSLYDWTKISTSEENTTKFYIDDEKFISIYQYGGTFTIGVGNIKFKTAILSTTSASATISTRAVKCKSGVMFQCGTSPVTYNSPVICICNSKNLQTDETGKALFCITRAYTSTIGYFIYSSDNVTESISSDSVTVGAVGSKVTSIAKFTHKQSECSMENLYFIIKNELSTISLGNVTLKGKNYYMLGSILMED